MPVYRFRSMEEMNAWDEREAARRKDESATEAFNRFARHCATFWKLHPRRYPRGLFRYRSVEELPVSASLPD